MQLELMNVNTVGVLASANRNQQFNAHAPNNTPNNVTHVTYVNNGFQMMELIHLGLSKVR